MAKSESYTLQMLRRIDQKLEKLLQKLSTEQSSFPHSTSADSLLERAKQIAALTPRTVRQTDAVELLREDRSR